MPTFEALDRFLVEYARLSVEEKRAFQRMRRKFVADLRTGRFRAGLRIGALAGYQDLYEITWAPNGRALFEFGPSVRAGERHIIWRRVGGHEIFDNP